METAAPFYYTSFSCFWCSFPPINSPYQPGKGTLECNSDSVTFLLKTLPFYFFPFMPRADFRPVRQLGGTLHPLQLSFLPSLTLLYLCLEDFHLFLHRAVSFHYMGMLHCYFFQKTFLSLTQAGRVLK